MVVISAAVGVTGCILERTSDTSGTYDLLACETSGHCEPATTASVEQSLLDLPRNGLPIWAISRDVLTAPGTQDLLHAIQNGGLLNPSTLSNDNRDWILTNNNVRDLMKYVVSCALNDAMRLEFDVPGKGSVSWPGELGLCGATPGTFGNWAYDSPSAACLEIVSSCVLARVNALPKKVVISMRGESSALMPLLSRVPVVKEYREDNGTPIVSFTPCTWRESLLGPTRNCGWEGRYVGSCIPDQIVTLQTTAPAMVRVCRGIHGCNQGDIPPWYSGVIQSFAASTNPVSFTCPHNGISLSDRSYFAVMLASPPPVAAPLPLPLPRTLLPPLTAPLPPPTPSTPNTLLPAGVDVTITSGQAWYPSSESEVFRYREGAFFGNIFNVVSPYSSLQFPQPYMLVGYQYACYSEIWTDGAAHFTDRLCAEPNSWCFENAPERCRDSCPKKTSESHPIYTECNAGTPNHLQWTYPITVYLNHPCDLARDLTSCKLLPPSAFPRN
ncbi:MAG TPA: hypothetical protein VNO30_25625 [Kofleriaceae bacterium]|nr:hypothetical protein [Kofleriaceae bacterium]